MRTLHEILHGYHGEVLSLGVNFNSEDVIVLPSVIPQSIIDAGGIPVDGGAIYIIPPDWNEGHPLPAARVEVEEMTPSEDCYNYPESNADSYN